MLLSLKRIFQVGLLSLLLAAASVQAQLVEVPTLQARVTDLTQTLTPQQQAELEAKLRAFEQEKGSQIAVLIIPTTQPEDIAQYSIRVVEAWKLGRKQQDDGVLLLVAKQDRKIRIEVGYGLEGAIPDLIAKRIITEIIAPSFKRGDFAGGIAQALDKIMALISGEQLAPPTAPAGQVTQDSNLFVWLLFGALALGAILRAVLGGFMGGLINGGLIAALVLILGMGLAAAILLGLGAFVFTLLGFAGLSQMGGLGGYGNSGGGDVFSGGGGDFGGGGASGDW